MDNEHHYTWPYPGQMIYPRVPGAKWHNVCEFCDWNWFSQTFEESCYRMRRHLLEEHEIDIDHS